MIKIVNKPSWLARAHETSCVSVADLAEMFGVHQNTIHDWVRTGKLPQPDHLQTRRGGLVSGPMKKKLQWKAPTIRRLIRDAHDATEEQS